MRIWHCPGSCPQLLKFVSEFILSRDYSPSVASATAIVRNGVWGWHEPLAGPRRALLGLLITKSNRIVGDPFLRLRAKVGGENSNTRQDIFCPGNLCLHHIRYNTRSNLQCYYSTARLSLNEVKAIWWLPKKRENIMTMYWNNFSVLTQHYKGKQSEHLLYLNVCFKKENFTQARTMYKYICKRKLQLISLKLIHKGF